MKKRQVKKEEPETYEEFMAVERDQFGMMDIRREPNIPPANYAYTVGEEVTVGNLSECRVEEVLMDGRLLHISRHDRGVSYGKAWDAQRRLPLYRWWVDVEPIVTVEDTHFRRERIHTDYRQNSLDSLILQMYSRGHISSPEYQRGYVWTLEDKQRLVQSIFDRADIGKFLFLERDYPENRLEVIDGKQRLNAIQEFIEGRFEFKGKTWFQLSHRDKQSFTNIMVQTAQLDAKYVSKSDILWLFLTVNVGGVPQTEEHIAKAREMYEAALIAEGKA